MISKEDNPMEWAQLMYELEDAAEHLAELTQSLCESGSMEDEDFGIQLGHIYAHLNTAWHRRNLKRDATGFEWKQAIQFPTDIKPV